MASYLTNPSTSSSGLGKKATDKGQFANPPEYTDLARMTGSSLKGAGSVGKVQGSPSAKKGKV